MCCNQNLWWPNSYNNLNLWWGANEIQWTNMITLEKDYMSFFPEFLFTWINFGIIFLQLVIVNFFSCPNTWHVFLFIIFEKIWIFEGVPIPCKFNVLSLKMIIISNHNHFIYFYIFMFFFLYNRIQLFLTHHLHFTPFMYGKRLLKF
jgi:hypothetical protein